MKILVIILILLLVSCSNQEAKIQEEEKITEGSCMSYPSENCEVINGINYCTAGAEL